MKQRKEIILQLAEKIYPRQVQWRRWLHRHPELSNQEFETTKFIKSELRRNGITTSPLKIPTGALVLLNGRKKTAIAIRADIDALAIKETSGVPFCSSRDGIMHACGHDVHTAIAMGAAVIIHDLRASIPGAVKVLFQPSEEMPPGGAAAMIKAGILKKPDVKMILSLHVDPTLAVGKISLRDGPTMAAVIDFDIIVKGRGGHGARPHLGVDAISVAAELIESMQKVVSRETDPLHPLLITFGTIQGGTARNVLADRATLRATARTLSPETREKCRHLISRTVDGICRARGADYDLNFIAGYPVVRNHPVANRLIEKSFAPLFGSKNIGLTPQVMGGEDFGQFLELIPGAMFRLGTMNRKIGADKPWHSSDFKVDERAILYGTATLVSAILEYFEGQ